MNKALKEYHERVKSGEIIRAKATNPKERALANPTSRAMAVAAKCFDCCGEQREEIKRCPMTDCALWNFRPYKQKENNDE